MKKFGAIVKVWALGLVVGLLPAASKSRHGDGGSSNVGRGRGGV